MSAMLDLKWLPTGSHEVKVGKSLLNGSGGTQRVNREFYACHFREMPSSCDATGTLKIRAQGDSDRKTAKMERDHTNGLMQKADMHVFNGVESNTEDTDCILIFDEETGEFSLEKVETMFKFSYEKRVDKPARSPVPPQLAPRSVAEPSSEIKKAGTSRPAPRPSAPARKLEVEDEPRMKPVEARKPLASNWDELDNNTDSKPGPAQKPKPRPVRKVPEAKPSLPPPPVARPPILPGSGPAVVLPGMSLSPVLPTMPVTTTTSKPISTVSIAASEEDEWDVVPTPPEPSALPTSLNQVSSRFELEELDADDMSPQHAQAPLPPTYGDPDDMRSQPADVEDDYLADMFSEDDDGGDDDMEEVAAEPLGPPDDDFLAAEMMDQDQESDEDSDDDSDDD